MSAIINVCAYCNREIEEDNQPGAVIENHNRPCDYKDMNNHGVCKPCKEIQDREVATFREKVKAKKQLALSRE